MRLGVAVSMIWKVVVLAQRSLKIMVMFFNLDQMLVVELKKPSMLLPIGQKGHSEMPQELDNLSYWLGKLYDWVKNSMKTFQASTNRKGNIVNGYVRSNGSQAINGLDQLFPNNPRKFNKEVTSKIINCAEIIRRYFGDIYGNGKNDERQIEMGNGNELGITTKRR